MEKVLEKEVLDYPLNVCQGQSDLLVRRPDNIILQIVSFPDLDDIGQLSKTCKQFQKEDLKIIFTGKYYTEFQRERE